MNKQFFSQNSLIDDDMIVIKIKKDSPSGPVTSDMSTEELINIYNKILKQKTIPVFCYYKYLAQTAGRPYDTCLVPCSVISMEDSLTPVPEETNIIVYANFTCSPTGVNSGIFPDAKAYKITIAPSGALSTAEVS